MSEAVLVKPAEETTAETIDFRVNRLFRELHRAVRLDRPSIVLAVYRSEFVHTDAAHMLTERLHTIGQGVTLHHVTGEANDDIPVHLINHPDYATTVFFVSGLRWGSGIDRRNAYRALNIRREYLVDACIRVVFWITDIEEISLPDYAPDFWAFRHRVVDFLEPPNLEQIQRTASHLLWRDFSEQGLREHNAYKIALHESLLKDLRRYDELNVLRGTTLYTLARLRQARGEYARTLALLQEALDSGNQANDARLQSDCYLARGTIHNQFGHYGDAIADFQRVVTLSPSDPVGYISLSNVYRLSGRVDEAMALCIKALALDAACASTYASIGHVLRTQQMPTAAIEAYQQAIRLDPQDSDTCISLGNLYREQQRYDEALAAYQQAIEHNPNDAHPYKELGDVYVYFGHSDKAAEAYHTAAVLEQESPLLPGDQAHDGHYTPYEVGFEALLNRVDSDDPRYSDIVALGQRLQENIRVSRLSGDSDMSRAERAEILHRLNELALATTNQTFNDLCQFDTSLQLVRDRLSYYEDGLRDMLKKLDRNNPRYRKALVYEQQLRENIFITRQEGENNERQTDRTQIIDQLNNIARSELGLSFNDLCRRAASEQQPLPPPDTYAPYEQGLRELLHQLGTNHDRFAEALIFEQRLHENIERSRMFGGSLHLQTERAEILDQLNRLALDALGRSFVELCGLETSASIQPAGDRYAHYEVGLRKLQEIGANSTEKNDALRHWYERQLRGIIAIIRRYGDTYTRQRERATIISHLNDRMLPEQSFFNLCRQADLERGVLDSGSPLTAQYVLLLEKRSVLEQAFEQHGETIRGLDERRTHEDDPVWLSRIAQELAEAYQQWVRTLLQLEAVEKSLREIYAVL